MSNTNIKTTKKCAFCKHWYDPTNSAISPQNPRANVWKIEDESKKMCLLKNYGMPAMGHCTKYECKLEIQTR